MTKTEVEVITSVQRRRRWSRAEKDRCCGDGARSDCFRGGLSCRDPCEPVVSVATIAIVPEGERNTATSVFGACRGY
jgi:hypothetical protein